MDEISHKAEQGIWLLRGRKHGVNLDQWEIEDRRDSCKCISLFYCLSHTALRGLLADWEKTCVANKRMHTCSTRLCHSGMWCEAVVQGCRRSSYHILPIGPKHPIQLPWLLVADSSSYISLEKICCPTPGFVTLSSIRHPMTGGWRNTQAQSLCANLALLSRPIQSPELPEIGWDFRWGASPPSAFLFHSLRDVIPQMLPNNTHKPNHCLRVCFHLWHFTPPSPSPSLSWARTTQIKDWQFNPWLTFCFQELPG